MTEYDSESSGQPGSESERANEPVQNDSAASGSSERGTTSATVLRFVSMGTELAAFTLTFTAIGYFLDSYVFRSGARYATAIGTLIGFVLGMIRFITVVRRHPN